MTSDGTIYGRAGYKWIAVLLFTFAISLLNATEARAERCVADLGGVIDGFVTPNPPSQIQIDGNCIVRNFPASNPLRSNFSFYTAPGQTNDRWLIIFDNVVHTGNMSCNSVLGHHIWFTNGSSSKIKENCQNLLIPVEKIVKTNPPGQNTATIGVPFTWKMTIPVLFDPATGTVSNANGSPNDLHGITIWDDLTTTNADLTFVSERAYWRTTGAPIAHTFSNVGGRLTFDFFPVVPQLQQFVIEVTVVLNDVASNYPGKTFFNTAKWDFGRLIDGVYYEPLPGEWGISPPMTIAAPLLTVTKSGPATMNIGQWGNFAINVQNIGTIDAWNATINDLFPHGTTGGMCDRTPEILSAQVFAADGVTPVAGKGPLTSGSDYSLSYSPAPGCKLDMTMLTAAGMIGPTQRLIIRYRTQLDANTQNGVTLTNIAGAIQWFNGDISNTNRKVATRTLSNGTPGVLDHEDAFNVTTAVTGYFFEKTVADVTSGVSPATTAAPGDKLRYTLRFRTSQGLSNFSIVDDMDALNPQADFAAGTLTLVQYPTGADISATSSTGGTKGTGIIDIRNLSLPVNGEALILFEITLKSPLANGTIVSNQAAVRANNTVFALSDNPNVNGAADPTVSGDEDPTRVTIASVPPSLLVQKISTDLTGDPNVLLAGETLRYTITVRNTGGADVVNVVLRDALPANTTYVAGSTTLNGAAVADVAGASPLVNGLPISPISPANVATITFDVVVNANAIAGTVISNQGFVNATGIVDQPSDDPRTPTLNDPTVNIVGSLSGPVLVVTKSGPATMSLGQWGSFAINVQNTGAIDAWNAAIRDLLPQGTTGGMCALTPEILSAQVFAADGVTPVAGKSLLTSGSGYSLSYSAAPNCQLNITMLTAAGTIGPSQRLIIRYRTQLDSNTPNGVTLTNIAGAIQWFDADSSNANRKSSTRILTNGTPGTLDHEDAFNVNVIGSTPSFRVQKISTDLTGDPNILLPGERLRYTITVKNVGGADAVNSMLRDAVPANTTYVAGSTTLNGAPVADVAGGSPLVNGIQINSPANATPGLMPADPSTNPANVATIIFDVTVNQNAVDGTVISNQGFVNATGIVDQPSDDPRTPTLNDPTINIVSSGGPVLMVTKSGPATMNLGQWGSFAINVQNTGPIDAWNAAIRDLLPQGTTGGMCALTPEVLSAQVFAADGVTSVSGKGPLNPGSDYSLSYSAAPNCQLNITMLTAAGTIGPSQRLIIRYRTQLDANTQNGVTLTNIAGAIQWFDADSSSANRKSFNRMLTNGTPGTLDHEDAFNVNVIGSTNFRVQKISTDLTGDPNVLLAGEKLRYTITVKNISTADAVNVMLRDAMPANTTYVAGSTTMNGAAVADVAGQSPLVNGMLINSPANPTPGTMPADASSSQANVATIVFDVMVNSNVAGGTAISNQGFVSVTGVADQPSDDPRTPAPNDPTINIVDNVGAPVLVVTKSGPATMNLGQWGTFGIDVQNTGPSDGWNATIRDLLPQGTTGGMCNLTPEILSAQVFAADGVTPVAGKGALNPGSDYSLSYTAAPNCQLDITMLTAAGTIGPTQRLILRYRTQLDANSQNGVTLTNIAGAIQWFNADSSSTNRKTSTGTLTNGTPGVADYQDAHNVMVALSGYFFDKTVANLTSGVNPATTALPGDKLRYTLRFRTSQALSNFSIVDEMDALNAQPDFAAGTLTLVQSPAGADISATSSTGGTKGTGVIDIRNLSLPVNGEALIQFDITLKSPLANDTVVANQSTVRLANGTVFALSDDPNVNGTADSAVSGDEDPTRVKIVSSSVFRVQKISTDMTGDPNVLLAGEKLRYTITVQNISNADAVNVVLHDAVPANTTYVAGSTTLNGAAVPDVAGGSPLVNGMPINSPANATPGLMPVSSSQANVATITFDVIVNPNTPDGTVISNQGVVSATGIVDQPSDDPRTPSLNDPTVDIVGNRPALYAEKHVALFGDLTSPGIVDPGDVLRYTITIKNSATVPATGIVLTDPVPANTTYVANTTLLNGSPVPDGGGFPLASGINISTLSPGSTALLQYDLRVNPGTPAGTAISNQAVVNGTGLPNLLTDSDGNPANGPQPTVIVVGSAQQISISAQVSVVGGGPAIPGAQLDYVMNVVNTANVPAYNVVITDNLNATPGQLAYVNQSATVNGSAAGVSFAGSTITVDYGALSGPLAPGAVVVLRFRTTLNASLALGTVVTNTGVATWNNPTQTTSASVSITVGSVVPGTPGTPVLAVLNGSLWHDADFDDVQDSGERALAGWAVELYRDNQLSQSVQTDANGVYRIIDVEPNDTTGVRYELRFHAPGEGPNTAMLGRAASPFTNGLQRISDIIVSSGANLQGLNLPIHPNGVTYNSGTRIPVAGAILTLQDARSASPLPASCFDDVAQQGQITLADGYYKFDINFSDPAACPSGGNYLINVTAPTGANYVAGYSQIIPPTSQASTAAFSVPACPGSAADAILGTALFCEVQSSEFSPAASIPAGVGTTYHVHLMLNGSQIPGTSQVFNNHIPLDPQTAGSLSISKTTPLLNVTRGQLVPYTITVINRESAMATDVSIVDRLPAGFTYVAGSALLDGVPTEPSLVSSANGRTLNWNGLVVDGKQTRTVKLLVTAGAGIGEGQFVNRAQAMHGATGNAMSGEATATVRLVPDVTMDCTDVTGKVFNDVNRNGRQDDGEEGLPGVRVVTARGLLATTDQYGRYHITCAVTPNENRGSNFVLKLDDRTLPSGFRMTTDQMQIQRATRGKALRVSFGASIHRTVSLDLSDAAFEPGKTEIRVQWKPRLNVLLDELSKAPAVLRLSYVADTEDAALVKRRVEAIKRQLTEEWKAADVSYVLTIEPEVFWRRGAPVKRPDVRVRGGK